MSAADDFDVFSFVLYAVEMLFCGHARCCRCRRHQVVHRQIALAASLIVSFNVFSANSCDIVSRAVVQQKCVPRQWYDTASFLS